MISLLYLALGCVHRSYGNGGTVCVVNATYHDELLPISTTAKGVVTSYLTSISGDRFTKDQLHFSKTVPTQVAPTISITLDHKKKYQKIIG